MTTRPIRVAHVVPGMFIGGVEIAIQRSFELLNDRFDYRVFWVKRRGILPVPVAHVGCLLATVITGRWRPDVVVTSLWYAHPFGWLLHLLGCQWVAFFHNSGFSHRVDAVIHRWAWRCADHRLVDSGATSAAMCQAAGSRAAVTVPYIFDPAPVDPHAQRDIGFLWVGRAVASKRLDLLVEFLRAVRGWSAMRCVVVTAGEPPREVVDAAADPALGLELLCDQTNEAVLALLGRSRYYVLTSNYEGMSMTTIEAIQSGCMPVVRPVGEIRHYLDEEGAVFIADGTAAAAQDAARRVQAIDADTEERSRRVARALAGVVELGRYVDTFAQGIERMAGGGQR